MVTTAQRKHPHIICFKCSEDADATFAALAQHRRMPKGDLFIEMLNDYKERCLADEEAFLKEARETRLQLLGMIETTTENNGEKRPKKGRPLLADKAATKAVA